MQMQDEAEAHLAEAEGVLAEELNQLLSETREAGEPAGETGGGQVSGGNLLRLRRRMRRKLRKR